MARKKLEQVIQEDRDAAAKAMNWDPNRSYTCTDIDRISRGELDHYQTVQNAARLRRTSADAAPV